MHFGYIENAVSLIILSKITEYLQKSKSSLFWDLFLKSGLNSLSIVLLPIFDTSAWLKNAVGF